MHKRIELCHSPGAKNLSLRLDGLKISLCASVCGARNGVESKHAACDEKDIPCTIVLLYVLTFSLQAKFLFVLKDGGLVLRGGCVGLGLHGR